MGSLREYTQLPILYCDGHIDDLIAELFSQILSNVPLGNTLTRRVSTCCIQYDTNMCSMKDMDPIP